MIKALSAVGIALAAGLALGQTPVSAAGAPDFALKNGDVVVFYGDSITDQRLYTLFTETYAVTRFPDRQLKFVHSGWGGDRVGGGGGGNIEVRLKRDVIAHKPTVMSIMLGMNDGNYRVFNQVTYDKFITGYQHIIDETEAALPGIRITVILPSPFDDITQPPQFEGGYNGVLMKFSDGLRALAAKDKLNVADFNTAVVDDLTKAKATDPVLAQKIIPGRVHPSPGGHLIMAESLIKSWDGPALVTSVAIDGKSAKVSEDDNTAVTDVNADKGTGALSWKQMDRALPFPMIWNNPVAALAINSSDFVAQIDQEPLKVTGLKTGNYALKIDDSAVGTFSADQLAAGINLALLPTPMAAQADTVYKLTKKRSDLYNQRWRTVQVPGEKLTDPAKLKALPDELAALDAQEATAYQNQRAAAQPTQHSYQLSPAADATK